MDEKYIPLSAAVDEMKSWEQENKCYHPEDYEDEEQEEPGIPVLEVIERLNSIEPADVRPVVRGKWNKSYADHETFGVRPFFRYCSECHESTVYPYNFCPHCGADMRPEQRKEEK